LEENNIVAGSKQHFIPQFLLREFAHERKREEFQVRVYRADRTYLSAVEDAAAQNHFYSDPAIDPQLDKDITRAENQFAKIHRQLIDCEDVDAADAAVLIAHLAARGAYIRKLFEHAGSNMMGLLCTLFADIKWVRQSLGIDKPELEGRMRKRFDEKYNELKSCGKLPNLSRHDFRRKFHFELRHRFDDLWNQMSDERVQELRMMQEMVNAEFVADAHNQVLKEGFVPPSFVEAYGALVWRKIVDEKSGFILPDCVSIAMQSNGEFTPTILAGTADFQHVFFPITSTTVLVGSKGQSPDLSFCDLNQAFAGASWEFFISNPNLVLKAALKDEIRSSADRELQRLLFAALEDITSEN
jgi:Protein of unknown function (DUF4238)